MLFWLTLRNVLLIVLAFPLASLAIEVCPTGYLKVAREVEVALDTLGVSPDKLLALSKKPTISGLPAELKAITAQNEWAIEQVEIIYDVMRKMIREKEREPREAIEATVSLATYLYGGKDGPASEIVPTLWDGLESGARLNFGSVHPEQRDGARKSLLDFLQLKLKAGKGTLPAYEALSTSDRELFALLVTEVPDWRTRGAEFVGPENAAQFRAWEKPAAEFRKNRIERYLAGRTPLARRSATSMIGLARLARELGYGTMSEAYDAAVDELGQNFVEKTSWRRFPGTPDGYVRLSISLPITVGFRERPGLVEFAERHFAGDVQVAWDAGTAVMNQRFDRLGWGNRPVSPDGRVLLVAARASAERLTNSQLETAVLTMTTHLDDLHSVARKARAAPDKFGWVDAPATVGEWLHLPEWLKGLEKEPLATFRGTEGLERFARLYFGSDAARAAKLVRLRFAGEKWLDALDWPARPKNEVALPLTEPFAGATLPSRAEPLTEAELAAYTPAQRARLQRVLAEYVSYRAISIRDGRRDLFSLETYWNKPYVFSSIAEFQIQLKRFAQHFGIDFRTLDVSTQFAPKALRAEWQAEAVDRYLEWWLRNGRRQPAIADWRAYDGGIGFSRQRMYASFDYAPGEDRADARIFDNQQAALIAVKKRANELGLSFLLLKQFIKSKPTAQTRSIWQSELRELLIDWKARNPGKRPIDTDWTEQGVGISRNRVFVSGDANPIFSSREEANRFIDSIFGYN